MLSKFKMRMLRNASPLAVRTSVRRLREPREGQAAINTSKRSAALCPGSASSSSASTAASSPATPPNTTNKCLHANAPTREPSEKNCAHKSSAVKSSHRKRGRG